MTLFSSAAGRTAPSALTTPAGTTRRLAHAKNVQKRTSDRLVPRRRPMLANHNVPSPPSVVAARAAGGEGRIGHADVRARSPEWAKR